LSVTLQANPRGVLVTWPLSPANFQLQANTNANLNTGWTSLTNGVIVNNSLNTFTGSLAAPRTFFRLAPP
jgi:hypothetical protein